MAEPSNDIAIGRLEGRLAALERWTAAMNDRLEEERETNRELVTEVALMRQSVDRMSKATQGIEEMRGAGRVMVSILLAIGSIVGAVVGVAGGAWIKRLFGLE